MLCVQRCRNEYDMYYELRKSFLAKARKATGDQKHLVASHYAREATKCSQRMHITQQRTQTANFKLVNRERDVNTLDLHMLHVRQAVNVCSGFLNERRRALSSAARFGGITKLTVTIITGWGKHSSDGKGKIKPAIKNLLAKKNLKFSEAVNNPGMYIVNLLVR